MNAPEAEGPGSVSLREAWLLRVAFAFLCLAGLVLALAPAARSGDWSLLGSRLSHLVVLPVWALCAWLIHRYASRFVPGRDPYLLSVGLLLAGWGLLLVWRLSPSFGARQTLWLAVASGAAIAVLRGPSNLAWLRRFRYLWLSAAIALTAATLVFGTNPSGGQERLWLGCCGVYLQPSEPLRLFLVVFLASYLAERRSFGDGVYQKLFPGLLAPILLVWGASLALLLVQRDLGTGTLLIGLFAVLLFLVTGRWLFPIAAAALTLAASVGGYFLIPVVRARIDAWLNPWADPSGRAYQVVQGLIAIASGGVFGRGMGMGSPGFVPVAHTDFIFASIGEEWGLLGATAVIALLSTVVARGFRASIRSRDAFGAILAAGLSASIGLQALLIVGGVLRLLPLTGVTLPFVSYGGSSLVTSFVALGLMAVVSSRQGQVETFRRPTWTISLAFVAGWSALALAVGWWAVIRGPALTERTDNPRRSLAERVSKRGSILDRSGIVLAESTGERGTYVRAYPAPASAPITGYDSPRYGLAGLEASMDPTLRGDQGNDPVEVWWTHLLTGTPPPGLDIKLTVDSVLQGQAMRLLEAHRGAAVVLDPLSGEILALASSPSFDPGTLDETWSTLIARKDSPLLNRATQAAYQPGTALAPFVLAWATGQGLIRLETPAAEIGVPLAVDGQTMSCLVQPSPDEAQDYLLALRSGCPTPIADLGPGLGVDGLAQMLKAFGLQTAPLEELATAGGSERLPAGPAGQLRLEAAGQGGLNASPLQMARAFAGLVASGSLPRLRLVSATRHGAGEWQAVPVLAGPPRAIPVEVADRILASLTPPGSNRPALSGQAVVGPQDPPLAWFLGASLETSPVRVVVVVLEDSTPVVAAQVGSQILAAAPAQVP